MQDAKLIYKWEINIFKVVYIFSHTENANENYSEDLGYPRYNGFHQNKQKQMTNGSENGGSGRHSGWSECQTGRTTTELTIAALQMQNCRKTQHTPKDIFNIFCLLPEIIAALFTTARK